ncbi:sporulation phosphorelay system protein KapB [Paenibacillus sp. GCM10023252]|uniref:sporulation phosphorelay system protein KapB n=1 Tax=Paenibacillus sp. GCM10023252 TaxID=3252649 RepID=UPI003607FD92
MDKQLELPIGSIVQAEVRTGQYIGEIVELYGPRAVVKVLAVLKHPEQGDLHNPYDPDVAMFHERRALSFTEKTTVPMRDIQAYTGAIPEYNESLKRCLGQQIEALDRLKRWAERGLEQLSQLEKDYNQR